MVVALLVALVLVEQVVTVATITAALAEALAARPWRMAQTELMAAVAVAVAMEEQPEAAQEALERSGMHRTARAAAVVVIFLPGHRAVSGVSMVVVVAAAVGPEALKASS